jgi:hypothetical protein
MHKLGTLSPLIYFVNRRDSSRREGYIMVAPYSACPTPPGWERMEAGTLRECYALQARLQDQELDDWQREGGREIEILRARFAQQRATIVERMSRASTPFDRQYLETILQIKESRLAYAEQQFEHRNMYLHSLEHDAPKGRRDDEESVNVDRIG